MGEPDTKLVEAAIDVARAMEELSELIDVDVVEAAKDLADAAERPLNVDPEDRTSTIVQTGLLRSVDNILSGLMTPLVAFARDMGIGARKGAVDGSEEFTKKATQVVGWSALASITALASGYPSLFAWLTPVIALLKNKLGM
ncbi:MAG: hypothetical protein O3C34_18755 [Proteobacteria bacterium]|nr:hypothetical protein [Pseudomonadota bacterium]